MSHILRKEIDQDRTFQIDVERLGLERRFYEDEARNAMFTSPALKSGKAIGLFFSVRKLQVCRRETPGFALHYETVNRDPRNVQARRQHLEVTSAKKRENCAEKLDEFEADRAIAGTSHETFI